MAIVHRINIIAALGHRDRICIITLKVLLGLFQTFSPMIHERSSRQAPTDLQLYPFSKWDSARDLPSPFLGGSAPRLRSLVLENIPILASLQLQNIPQLGYISCFH